MLLIRIHARLLTKGWRNTSIFTLWLRFVPSLCLCCYHCEALRCWRQHQIPTADTHSIKALPQHPDVLCRASFQSPARQIWCACEHLSLTPNAISAVCSAVRYGVATNVWGTWSYFAPEGAERFTLFELWSINHRLSVLYICAKCSVPRVVGRIPCPAGSHLPQIISVHSRVNVYNSKRAEKETSVICLILVFI